MPLRLRKIIVMGRSQDKDRRGSNVLPGRSSQGEGKESINKKIWEVREMAICKVCGSFVKDKDDVTKGECVREEVDSRGGKFCSSKPVMADMGTNKCRDFKPISH